MWRSLGSLRVTAVAIVISLKGLRDQLWLQTFAEYTRRYLDALDALPVEATAPHGEWDLTKLAPVHRQALLTSMRRYLNLCSEEFYLQSRRRIDRETWRIWTAGMRSSMSRPAFRDGWALLGGEYEYYPAFHTFMGQVAMDAVPPADASGS